MGPLRRRQSDESLARAAGRGGGDAFRELFDRHHAGLLAFSRHMLGDADEAEDAVQHCFLQAHRTFADGTVPKSVRAWLYTVARNRCVSVLRARREQPGLDGIEEPSVEGLAATVQARSELRELLGDLTRLPEEQRAALLLAELGELTHQEVAAVIGVPASKVKALVFQAREALAAASHARSLDCSQVREEIATASAAGLRRRHLRLHLEACAGCRDFRDEVRTKRSALALLLPVVPTPGFRDAVLGLFEHSATPAAGVLGGGVAVAALKSSAAKVATGVALAGGAAGGTVVVADSVNAPARSDTARPAAAAPAAQATAPPAAPASGGGEATAPRAASERAESRRERSERRRAERRRAAERKRRAARRRHGRPQRAKVAPNDGGRGRPGGKRNGRALERTGRNRRDDSARRVKPQRSGSNAAPAPRRGAAGPRAQVKPDKRARPRTAPGAVEQDKPSSGRTRLR